MFEQSLFGRKPPKLAPALKSLDGVHVEKANPYHDALGRFSTKDTARFVSLWAKNKTDLMSTTAEDTREYKELPDYSIDTARYKGHHSEYLEDLDNSVHTSLVQYTTENDADGFRAINGKLRGTREPSASNAAKVDRHIENLDEALAGQTIGADIRGFRGIGDPKGTDLIKAFDNGTLIGTVLQDPGFVSASTSQKVARDWSSKVNLHMNVKKEQKGVHIESISAFANEKEFLLPRNTPMVIKSASKDKDGRLIIEVDVLPDAPTPKPKPKK